jgi:hypothetical protein
MVKELPRKFEVHRDYVLELFLSKCLEIVMIKKSDIKSPMHTFWSIIYLKPCEERSTLVREYSVSYNVGLFGAGRRMLASVTLGAATLALAHHFAHAVL